MGKPKLDESPNNKAKCRKCNCFIKPGMLRVFIEDNSGWQKYGKYAKGTEGEGRGYVETDKGVFRRNDKYYVHLRCYKTKKGEVRERSLFAVAKLSAEGEKTLAEWLKGPPPAKPKKPSKYEFYEEIDDGKEEKKQEDQEETARASRKRKREEDQDAPAPDTPKKGTKPATKRTKRV